MKNLFLLFLFISCFLMHPKLYGQNDLNYLRLALYGIESPASIHLKGKTTIKATAGGSSGEIDHGNTGLTLSYYITKLDFAFQLRLQDDHNSSFNGSDKAIALNVLLPISTKKILSIGGEVQYFTNSLYASELHWADQSDSISRFKWHTNEHFGDHTSAGSVNLAILFYDTSQNYFAGLICNNLNEPNISFNYSTVPGTTLTRLFHGFLGINYTISNRLYATSTVLYKNYNTFNRFSIKQDLMYKTKYWLSSELIFNQGLTLFLGYQPLKSFNTALEFDIQPNTKSPTGNANSYKLNVGYAF